MDTVVTTKKTGIKNLFTQKGFIMLMFATAISRFGDSLDQIAFGWMVYSLTGSKLLLGTLLAVNALPNLLFSAFAGVLVDRLKKKNILIFCNIVRGTIVSIIAVLFMTNLLKPWHLFISTFTISTFECFAHPAQSSILPLLLPKELFLTATSISQSVYKFAEVIGLALAGAFIGILGISVTIFIDGAVFFIAAFSTLFVKIKNDESNMSNLTVKYYFFELKEGFSFIKNNKFILTIITLFALINLCLAPISVMLPAFVKENLKMGPKMLSTLSISMAAGMILGGLLVAQLGSKFKIRTLILIGFSFTGINYTLLYIPGNLITNITTSCISSSIFIGLIGLSIPIILNPIQAYFLTVIPKDLLGRVYAVLTMISTSIVPLSSSASGVLTQYISLSALFGTLGAIVCLMSLILAFNKNFRQLSQKQ